MAKRRRRKRTHNPHRASRRAYYRAHNPHRRRRHHMGRRRRHANPFSMRGITHQIMPALIGAGGAVLTDVVIAYIPPTLMPATLQTGWGNILTRAVVAIGAGLAVGAASNKRLGQEVAAGGLVVVAYAALKQALAPTLGQSIKGLSGLADFGDYSPASQYTYGGASAAMQGYGMGAYIPQPRMGAYMPRMGAYMNPGAFLQAGGANASPIVAKQRAMAGFGNFGGGGYDSESM